MKKVLITGGAGFIGYHLAEALRLDSDNQITIVDSLLRGKHDQEFAALLDSQSVKFYNLDLTDINSLKNIWQYYDEVYHFAAVIGVKHCLHDPAKVLTVNLKSTLNIVELAKANNCKKLMFSSTCETYAGGFELGIVRVPTPETVPLSIADINNPRWSYAVSKIAGEQIVAFNAQNHYKYSIVRFHNIIGPRMGYAHVIPEILKRIHNQENPFHIYSHDQTRSFCYIEDCLKEVVACMRSESADNQIIHIGNNSEEVTIEKLVSKIFNWVGYDVPTIAAPSPPGSVKRRCPDITKMRTLTGVVPSVTLDNALAKIYEWYWPRIKRGEIWE